MQPFCVAPRVMDCSTRSRNSIRFGDLVQGLEIKSSVFSVPGTKSSAEVEAGVCGKSSGSSGICFLNIIQALTRTHDSEQLEGQYKARVLVIQKFLCDY